MSKKRVHAPVAERPVLATAVDRATYARAVELAAKQDRSLASLIRTAIKQHLANLYTKFDIGDGVANRRSRLANEALRRGAVTLADLRRGQEQ